MLIVPVPIIRLVAVYFPLTRFAGFIFKGNDRINPVSTGENDGYCAVAKKLEEIPDPRCP